MLAKCKNDSRSVNLSENTVRKCISALADRGFIRKRYAKRIGSNGKSYQWNNNYYILDLPELPSKATVTA